jgi:hypothetical protein
MLIQQIACGGDSGAVLTGKPSEAEVMQDLSNRISMVENAEVSLWIGKGCLVGGLSGVGTYNINAQKPALSSRSLSTWILDSQLRSLPDIVVVG